MQKRLVIMSMVLLLLFGGLFGWKYYTGKKMAAAMSAPQPPAVVASAQVRLDTWHPVLTAVGTLVPSEGVFVANEVAGIIRSIEFESGQSVNAGDLLVQLDDEADRADLAALVAKKRLAELNFARARKLLKEKTVSQSAFDEAKAELDSAAALVEAKRATIAKKAVRAPFDGALGIREVDLGQYLAPGSRIVSLQSKTPILVDFNLPERHLADLRDGQSVQISVQAYPQRTFTGVISTVSPRVEQATRSVHIRSEFENPDGVLKPGMFASVRVELPVRSGVLTLPERAVTYNPYGDTVFFIEEKDGGLTVNSRPVQTGAVRDGRIEIIAGLEEGDRVASDGLNKLRNGQAVTVDNSVQLDTQAAAP
jgi:membrane fusion protein (multidrug efflux system)